MGVWGFSHAYAWRGRATRGATTHWVGWIDGQRWLGDVVTGVVDSRLYGGWRLDAWTWSLERPPSMDIPRCCSSAVRAQSVTSPRMDHDFKAWMTDRAPVRHFG